MNNYGFNGKIVAANHASDDAWQARSEKNKNRDHTRGAQLGLPGRGDLQGNGIREYENVQMSESDGMADGDEKRDVEGQFLEIGNGLQVRKTAFWLDVVPGI